MQLHDLGVDISTWQGKVDFSKLKSVAKFIIPRQGYAIHTDTRFFEYVYGAKQVGIAVPAVYHFIYATTCAEAMAHADKVIADVERAGLDKNTIIFADLEYDTIEQAKKKGINLTNEKCRDIVVAFCEQVKRYGYQTGIYLNIDFLHRYGVDIADKYDIWLAEWGTSMPTIPCMFWQARVSQAGEVAGVSTQVDIDFYRGKHCSNANKPDHSEAAIKKIAVEVILGKWSTGADRKAKLTAAGYNYATVQSVVNEMLKHKYLDTSNGAYYDTLEQLIKAGIVQKVGNTIILL